MANVVINRTVFLDAPISVDALHGVAFTDEVDSHKFVVTCMQGGSALVLSGGVSGKMVLADGTSIQLMGESPNSNGGKAVLTLTQECYAVPGRFQLAIFNTVGTTVVCIYACVGTIQRSHNGELIDGGSIIPTVDHLIAEIQAAVETIPPDYSALVARVDKNRTDIDTALNVYPDINLSPFVSGGISASGGANNLVRRLRVQSNWDGLPIVQHGDYYWCDQLYRIQVGIYDSTALTQAHFLGFVNAAYISGAVAIPDSFIGRYAAVSVQKVGYEDAPNDISEDRFTLNEHVKYFRPGEMAKKTDIPALDTTLAVQGAAAEAKATGDAIAQAAATAVAAEKRFLSVLPELGYRDFSWRIGSGINGNSGNYNSNNNFAATDDIPVREGQSIINVTGDIGNAGQETVLYVAQYNGDTFISGGRVQVPANTTFTVPSGVTKIRIMYGYGGTERSVMTWQLMEQYFKVRMLTDAAQYGAWNDGTKPVYVAFGASTTEGCVHHQSGSGITVSANNWPDYLGKIYGMEAHNLGVGSTGFMERGDRTINGTANPNYGNPLYYPNICDSILQNDELLSRAGLITIMFGYGNDNWVGPSDNIKRFMIGDYNDYYPYDKAARIGYDPVENPNQKRDNVTHYDTAQGLTEMIMDGATLMGCLNWCIEWISTKYPYAQLVIIFGSPSANDGREITKAANSETPTQGVAPYKLTFASDPYQSAEDHSGKEYGVYLINEQLKLLVPALNIPVINMFYGGNAFNWYSTYAKDPNNASMYALFSTKGTTESPTWNSHPNDAGYLYFARFIAGRIAGLFRH